MLPAQSVTLYVLVTTSSAPSHNALVTSSLIHVTVKSPSQLSASSVTTVTSGAGTSLKHSTPISLGLLAVGGVTSSM